MSAVSLPSPKVRQYIYAVATSAMAILVIYKFVDPTAVPVWLNIVGTVLGLGASATATAAVTKQRKSGDLP